MPKPNPKQAAKLIANLQEAMCRRQEEAELKLATARTAVRTQSHSQVDVYFLCRLSAVSLWDGRVN